MPVVLRTVTEPSIVLTGTLTFGSAVVTGLSSTAALSVGQIVRGTGIVADTLVLTINSPTQVTLTEAAQANGATALTFPVEPVSLKQAKKQCKIELDFTEDDPTVARMIGAARRACEVYVKRGFLATTFDASWDCFPSAGGYYNRSLRQIYSEFGGGMAPGFLPTNTGILELPRPDLISVTSVTYLDSNNVLTVMPSSNYRVETGIPGRISPTYGTIWPVSLPTIGAVTIRFIAGYGTTPDSVPDDVKSAILIMVSHLYENRGEENVELPATVRYLLASARWGSYS